MFAKFSAVEFTYIKLILRRQMQRAKLQECVWKISAILHQ
jgi:hypothetical protein